MPNNPSTVKRVKKLRFLVSAIFISWLMAQCALLLYWWTWWHAPSSSSFSSSSYYDYDHNSKNHPKKDADGWINGIIPLQLVVTHAPPPLSSIHCVGENFQNNSWWYKSCHFTNLCYHIPTKEFHLLLENEEQQEDNNMAWFNESNFYSSTVFSQHNSMISPGGIVAEEPRRYNLPWFPKVVLLSPHAPRQHQYWQIPSQPVLIPFYPRLANNPGHLIWDNWMAIYQLLRMFLLLPNDNHDEQPALPQILFHNLRTKGRCRYLDHWCQTHMIQKFLPLLGVLPEHYLDLTKANITTTGSSSSSPSPQYLCFDHAVAGLGILTDHGTNQRHGQYLPDYLHPHNAVRGPIFYDFRNWVLRNLHLHEEEYGPFFYRRRQQQHPHGVTTTTNHGLSNAPRVINITMSINSTKDPLRYWNSDAYLHAMQQELLFASSSSSFSFQLQSVVVSQLSATEQVQLAVQSTMYLTVVGGGSVTAMWLPPGASLLLFYPVLTFAQTATIVDRMIQTRKRGPRQSDLYLTNVPRLTLDWDVWNHLSYIRVHWLPLPTTTLHNNTTTTETTTASIVVADPKEEEQSIKLLLQLIRHEAAALL
jgi:hypothetical protein